MSIYNFAPFKSSAFGETITYTPTGAAAKSISAVVSRAGAQKIDVKGGLPTQYYPVVIWIDRTDIMTVTPLADTVTCADAKGVSKTFQVNRILRSDDGCYKLGLM